MSRTLTADFMRAAYSSETGLCPIVLMTITHESLSEPIRVSTDPTQRLSSTSDSEVVYGTISNGDEYIFFPVSVTLPSEIEDGAGNMRLEIDNIKRALVPFIRNLSSPPLLQTDIVTSDDPDVVVASWFDYLMTDITINDTTISAELQLDLFFTEPFPAGTFGSSEFPGLF